MATLKTIGILGGMGPGASANFYTLLVKRAQQHYGAVQDIDYPPVVLYSLPLEDFDERGVVNAASVKSELVSGVKKLEQMGADVIVIPCNTVHYFYDEMQKAVRVPIISIIEETARAFSNSKCGMVGILASDSTRKLGLYSDALEKKGIAVTTATPAQQHALDTCILHIMSGKAAQEDETQLSAIMDSMVAAGALGIVLGCTELPLIARGIAYQKAVVFDSADILAQSALSFVYTH